MYGLKQRVVLQLRRRPLIRRHLFHGATRSGKTWAVVPGFANWALAYPEPANYLAASKTWLQIKENLIPEFQRYALELGLGNIEPTGSNRYLNMGHMRIVFAEGGKHDSAAKLKSMKFRGVLLNEVTEMSEEFVLMAESRCLTYPDWKNVMDCNPEGPGHWVKQLYLDPAVDGNEEYEQISFLIPDNPVMTGVEVARLFRKNSALWRQRMLEGKWVAATGAIYPEWQSAEPPSRDPDLRWASLDYAASGIAHGLLFEQYGDRVIIADEWRYDGRATGPLRMERKARRIVDWIGARPIALMLIDPSTPNDMKAELADRLRVNIVNAPNDVREGINATAAWLEQPHLYISDRCPELIRELGAYVWDEAAAARGEDKPVKRYDHGMDSMRYGVTGYVLIERYGDYNVIRIEHAMTEAA